MVNRKVVLSSVMLGLGLSACSLKASEPVPAILPETISGRSAARSEIIDIVSTVLGGKKVPIAQDVFQESSRLLLGSKPIVAPNGVIVHGSSNTPALVFELIKQGENCFVRRLDTMQSWPLKTTLCVKR